MTIALSDAHFTRHPVPLARQAADRRKAFYARMDQHARTMASEQRAILAAVPRCSEVAEITADDFAEAHRFLDQQMSKTIEEQLRVAQEIVKAAEAKAGVVTIRRIQNTVCAYYSASLIDLISDRRTAIIVKPRQIAIFLSKALTPRSLQDIGRQFGGRDHTTALHAVKKYERLSQTNPKIAAEIAELRSLIEHNVSVPVVRFLERAEGI